MASHRSPDACLNEVHIRFHAAASSPEGPAAPSILRAVLRMSGPSIFSKMTGWGSTMEESGLMMVDCFGGCFGGCFDQYFSNCFRNGARIDLPVQMEWAPIDVL